MHWILILSMFVSSENSNATTSITAVPGFVTEQECKDAGDAFRKLWRQDGITGEDRRQAGIARYTCVKQTKAKVTERIY